MIEASAAAVVCLKGDTVWKMMLLLLYFENLMTIAGYIQLFPFFCKFILK